MTDQNTFFDFDDPTDVLDTVKEKTETDTTKVETKVEPDKDVAFFGEDKTDTTKEVKDNAATTSFKDVFSTLIEDGKFTSIDKIEDLPETLDVANAAELIEKEVDVLFEQEFNSLMGSLGSIGTDFLRYAKNGGNPETFISKVTEKPIVSKMPFDTDDDKENFLKVNYMKFEGKDSEEADLLVKAYKDNGKLNSIAEKVRDKRIEEEVAYTKKLADDVKQQKTADIAARSKERSSLEEAIKKTDDVLGIQITNKNKIVSFVNDYKFVDKSINKELTAFDVELNKALQDPTKKLVLAEILLNNFNFDKFKIKAKQEIVGKMEKQSNDKVRVGGGKLQTDATGFRDFLDMI
jgi:hypothetical protein